VEAGAVLVACGDGAESGEEVCEEWALVKDREAALDDGCAGAVAESVGVALLGAAEAAVGWSFGRTAGCPGGHG